MTLIEKGTNFNFQAQLFNAREDRFVKLELLTTQTNPSSVIGTYSLTHIGGGLYEKKDLIANNEGIFIARYTVFKNAALTRIDKKYQIKFEKIRVESIIEQITETIDFGDGQTV